jgi:hypothetical protein
MKPNSPSPDQWRELFEAASAFHNLAPWQWMSDGMLFGVQDPATGTTGYCCVLGALGSVFALNVYPGGEGLECYNAMNRAGLAGSQADAPYTQRLLMASYEDRKDLDKRDLQPIKALGLTFRGRQMWPQFRDYWPGLFPWYIDAAQARFLTHALQQAHVVALRVRNDPDMLLSNGQGLILVRVLHSSPEGISWTDSWLPPDPPPPARTPISVLPSMRDLKGLKGKTIGKAVWELDYWHVATTIQEKSTERPYFPKMLMAVEAASELVVVSQLFRPDMPAATVQSEFLRSICQAPELPGEIRLKRDELLDIIGPVGLAAGLRVRKVKSLPGLGRAWDELHAILSKNRG